MKLTLLFFLICLAFSIFCDNFQAKIYESKIQCDSLVEILKNVTTQNEEIQKGIVNVAVLMFSTSLDVDCILRELQKLNPKVVIYDVMSSTVAHNGEKPDYLIYLEDFLMDVS